MSPLSMQSRTMSDLGCTARLTLVILAPTLMAGCFQWDWSPSTQRSDAGADVGMDAGPGDAGPSHVGPSDAGWSDAGHPDSGHPDSGHSDSGPSDSGPRDGGPADGGPIETGDSGARDAGTPTTRDDAGPHDAGCAADYCIDSTTLYECAAMTRVMCSHGCADGECADPSWDTPDAGAWLPCCVDQRIQSCFCAGGDICELGQFSFDDCGEGDCVSPRGTGCSTSG